MMTFFDHFSDHADRYEAYPDTLFACFASLAPAHDCAIGNGRTALSFTPPFVQDVAGRDPINGCEQPDENLAFRRHHHR
jgi:hypothetical protein